MKVEKIDKDHVSMEIGGQIFTLDRKDAAILAAELTVAFIGKSIQVVKRKRKQRNDRPKMQFEIYSQKSKTAIEIERILHSMGIRNAEWYPFSNSFGGYVKFVTSSQRIIDRVNEKLGTKLTFDFLKGGNIYYL